LIFHQPESEGKEMQRREGRGAAHQPKSEMKEMQRREGRGESKVSEMKEMQRGGRPLMA
jgi:hypothetical protein